MVYQIYVVILKFFSQSCSNTIAENPLFYPKGLFTLGDNHMDFSYDQKMGCMVTNVTVHKSRDKHIVAVKCKRALKSWDLRHS